MLRSLYAICVISLAASAHGSEPFLVLEGKDAKMPKQPQACASASGIVHLTFGVANEVYYCKIAGENRPTPTIAFNVPNMSIGLRRGPRIAHSGAAIVITAIGGMQGKGKDGDVLAYHSIDDGKRWLGPVKVNDVAASAREGLHAMTAAADGTLWCVWLDLREKGTQLFASKSTDDGVSWSKNILVYRSPDGSVCECCHPSIVAGQDSLHVLFRNSLKGNRDMYLVSSDDRGISFGDAIRLGENYWPLNACPMDGGMLAIDKHQRLATVWRRDRSIFSIEPKSDTETILGTGEQPWVASDNAGFYKVWTSKRDGELRLVRPDSTVSERLDDSASFPVVVSSNQMDATAYVFWEKRIDQVTSIMGQRIR